MKVSSGAARLPPRRYTFTPPLTLPPDSLVGQAFIASRPARTLLLNSSTVNTHAMLRDISSSAIQWLSLPRMLATQSEITTGV